MISPLLFSLQGLHAPAYDPNKAKKLLADAGYPGGFEVTMDCPNDRYVNDEAICQAVVAMLARVGVKINLLAQPKAKYFAKVLVSGGYDTSFYLLGWTPGSFDSWNIFRNMYRCRDEKGIGGQSIWAIIVTRRSRNCGQGPRRKRQGQARSTDQASLRIEHEDGSYVPLHQQALVWGVSNKVTWCSVRTIKSCSTGSGRNSVTTLPWRVALAYGSKRAAVDSFSPVGRGMQ